MKTFKTLTAVALCALFMTACDNVSTGTQQANMAQNNTEAQGVSDFKKLVDWHQAQEQTLLSLQNELQANVASGDKAKIEEGLKQFSTKLDAVLRSLDGLDIRHNEINEFKAKTKQTLVLSNELLFDSVKAMSNPTAEAQQLIQEKSQALLQTGQELQQLQLQLQQKFMSATENK